MLPKRGLWPRALLSLQACRVRSEGPLFTVPKSCGGASFTVLHATLRCSPDARSFWPSRVTQPSVRVKVHLSTVMKSTVCGRMESLRSRT